MIIVKVELLSAISGETNELARMTICNTGESENVQRSDYTTATFKGRGEAKLRSNMIRFFTSRDEVEANKGVSHKGFVKNHARLQEHVWVLVARALVGMGYAKP